MGKRVIDDNTLTAIANKIRKNVPDLSDAIITPLEMPEKIDVAYEKGKQAQYDEFWDNFLDDDVAYGVVALKYLFAGKGWDDITFSPNRSFAPTNAEAIFRECRVVNLAEILERNKVTFDFSNCLYFDYFAYGSTIKHFPTINMKSANYYGNMFNYCTNLETIDRLVLNSAGNQALTNSFAGCTKLANITIEGVIGRSFNIGQSPLTKESITSIVEHLSSGAVGQTLTLKKSAVNNAFIMYAAEFDNDWELGNINDWEPVVWAMGIGDCAQIGEHVYIGFADTNLIIRKDGDSISAGTDINEGEWTLIAHGADVKNEWDNLVSSKPNWTISLV